MAAMPATRVVLGGAKLQGSAAVLRSDPVLLSRSEGSSRKDGKKCRRAILAPVPAQASASGLSANDFEQVESTV
jgi:hypothetical protein